MDQHLLKLVTLAVLALYLLLQHLRRTARRRAWRRLRTRWDGRVLEAKPLIRYLNQVRVDYQRCHNPPPPPGRRSSPWLRRAEARVRRLAFFRGREERDKFSLHNQCEPPADRPVQRARGGPDAGIARQFQPAPALA